MRIHVLVNPVSGRGRGPARAGALVRQLIARGHEVELTPTSRSGDEAAWARRSAKQADRLVVVGGDGTLNQTLRGLPADSPPVAIVPTGTGNVLAGELHVSAQPSRIVRLLEEGDILKLDIGEVGGDRVFMVWGFGPGGELVRRMSAVRGGTLRGRAEYAPHLLRMLREFDPPPQRVFVDEEDLGEFPYGIITGIHAYAHPWLQLAAPARDTEGYSSDYSDGRWEVYLFPRARATDMFLVGIAGFLKQAHKLPDIVRRSARTVRVEGSPASPVQVDGEAAGETPVEFRVLNQQLPLLVPRHEPATL